LTNSAIYIQKLFKVSNFSFNSNLSIENYYKIDKYDFSKNPYN